VAMKWIFLASVLSLLTGCTTNADDQSLSAMSEQAAGHYISPDDSYCRDVARQRAADARANGYSLELETSIFQGTYRDCITRAAQHPN